MGDKVQQLCNFSLERKGLFGHVVGKMRWGNLRKRSRKRLKKIQPPIMGDLHHIQEYSCAL